MSVGDYQDHSFLSILSKSIGDSYTNEINNEESKTQPYSKNESEDENNDKKNIELYEANNVILIQKQKDKKISQYQIQLKIFEEIKKENNFDKI